MAFAMEQAHRAGKAGLGRRGIQMKAGEDGSLLRHA